MSASVFLLWLVSIPIVFLHAADQPPPKGFLLNCGSEEEVKLSDLKFIPDNEYINTGNKTTLKQKDVHPLLATVRFFPDTSATKYCYSFQVPKDAKYMVKTMYYYGGFDGGKEPPVFDQIIDGTKWSIVNTTEDYANGLSSFYEIVVTAHAKTLSVCLARNKNTNSSPFISSIELQNLDASLYNTTDFNKFALTNVARSSFGYNGEQISSPDDKFNRFWQPFMDDNPVVDSKVNITPTAFWNIPPTKLFANGITTSRGKTLNVKWPQFLLPSSTYYIALYFQENRNPSPESWRVFSVTINGMKFYDDVNVTTNGVTVYATQWPLSGQLEIVMTPQNDMPVGPVINGGEIFQILRLGGVTNAKDVLALEELAKSFDNKPSDWRGDPCLPKENSWTGVKCSDQGFRVTSLNLTGVGLSGSLSKSIDDLTALNHLLLGSNKLSGPIPEMKSLKALQTLHLENNQFEGQIPASLAELTDLKEIFLQNNNLDGNIPDALKNKNGIKIQV
ncbi:receptor-like protein kinase At3g21340 [Cornus florida]|uniref:receptor-like protein kinase At3g21340 n=1 Tax=Cornus florida TaxID=4283 RepID=UPI00289BAB42|nr:receptor-like protein kinase At3g21340 [Cornus florida]